MCRFLVIYVVLPVDIWAFAYAVKKQSCPVDDDTYETLYKLCEDSFDVPVRERTKAQKAACVRFGETGKHLASKESTQRNCFASMAKKC